MGGDPNAVPRQHQQSDRNDAYIQQILANPISPCTDLLHACSHQQRARKPDQNAARHPKASTLNAPRGGCDDADKQCRLKRLSEDNQTSCKHSDVLSVRRYSATTAPLAVAALYSPIKA